MKDQSAKSVENLAKNGANSKKSSPKNATPKKSEESTSTPQVNLDSKDPVTHPKGEETVNSKTSPSKGSGKRRTGKNRNRSNPAHPVNKTVKDVWFTGKVMNIGYRIQNPITGKWTVDVTSTVDFTYLEDDVFSLVKETHTLSTFHFKSTKYDVKAITAKTHKVEERLIRVISKFYDWLVNFNKLSEKTISAIKSTYVGMNNALWFKETTKRLEESQTKTNPSQEGSK